MLFRSGRGGEHAPDIATRPDVVSLSDSGILKVLREGKPQAGMPSFAGLGPAKLSETLNYLRFLQGKGRKPTVVVNTEKGKEIFIGKGDCSECHMVHGSGGFLGPDLSDYGASHSADDIRSAIVNAEKRSGFRKGLAKATTRDGGRFLAWSGMRTIPQCNCKGRMGRSTPWRNPTCLNLHSIQSP